MKVLLTGASGFVGSHVLDSLRARGIASAVLLRVGSDRRLLQHHLPALEIRTGSIDNPESLNQVLGGITHVIHCAGCTKARLNSEFDRVNHLGTQNIVSAVNAHRAEVERLVHVSSLAASGPATASKPATEVDTPRPVSAYGASKLAAELVVAKNCEVDFTILRPPAVYGPRDYGFLSMFKAVKAHVLPRPAARQDLSLVYAQDLADAVVACLDHPKASAKTYFVASSEIVTGRIIAEEIAAQMKQWTVPLPLPAALLWPVCLFEQFRSRFSGKPALLNLQKFAELRAPGWVCDPSRLAKEVGFECQTTLKDGISQTLKWYQQEGWL